jgi:hypothetical protein
VPLNHESKAEGFFIALMMEAAKTSENSVNFYQTTRRYNPEDSHLFSFSFFKVLAAQTRLTC